MYAPARIRKVMAKLKRQGLLTTKEGAEGGYSFTLDADKVTLRMVNEAIGEPMVAASWHSGRSDMECLIASGMASVMDGIYADLDDVCRQQLEKTTIAGIDRMIFREKKRPEHSGNEKSPSESGRAFWCRYFLESFVFCGGACGEYGGYRGCCMGCGRRTFPDA